MCKLIILGNGFDLCHGLKTGYRDFHDYLNIHNPLLLEKLNNLFDVSDFWSDFEQNLNKLNIGKLIKDSLNVLNDIGNYNARKKTLRSIIENEVKITVDQLIIELKNELNEWILCINESETNSNRIAWIDNRAKSLVSKTRI